MSLLPRRLLQSAKSFIVNRPSSIVFVLVFLFTIHYSLLTSAVKAAEQPNPQPCQNAKFDEDKLTDNWLTQDDGAPYITVTKPFDDQPVLFSFDVDFSKLSALFGPANSNYLEGNFQNKDPTTYSEFYEGRIIFKYALEADFQRIINGENCPPQLPREITFVMPEFFRTTAVTGQLNQIIVP